MKKSFPIAVDRPTNGDIVGAIEIPAKGRHKLVRSSAARLTLWWIEPGELVRFTLDPKPVQLGADHRAHNATRGIRVGDRDTTGSRKDGRQERGLNKMAT